MNKYISKLLKWYDKEGLIQFMLGNELSKKNEHETFISALAYFVICWCYFIALVLMSIYMLYK